MPSSNIPRQRLFVILCLVAAGRAFPQEAPAYSFGMRTTAGILSAVSQEIVYLSTSSDKLLSRLDWRMDAIPYWGLSLDVSPSAAAGPGFYARLDLKAGVPGTWGLIEDRDWLKEDGSTLTNLSVHDCLTEQALLADLDAGWSFRAARSFALRVGLRASAMRFKWAAQDGYYQYGPNMPYTGRPANTYVPWDASFSKVNTNGTGMDYEQTWLFASAVAGLEAAIGSAWSLSADLAFAPFAYCSDRDNHYMGPTEYLDITWGGWALEPRLACSFRPAPRLELGMRTSARIVSGLRGDVYTLHIGGDSPYGKSSTGAGVSYLGFDAGLSLRMSL